MSFLERRDFVRYDPDTGKIVMWGDTQIGAIVHMRLLGQAILEGYGRPETHHVDLETLTIVERPYEEPQMELSLESGT